MDTIIQTVLLASPALLEKHNIEGYMNFLEHLNDLNAKTKSSWIKMPCSSNF